MYNFNELDTLTDRLIDEEIQAYDLPYYIEPLLEGIIPNCEGWHIDYDTFQELYHSLKGYSECG